ncbi:MAG: hypothetical protein JF593_08440 [Novosphingobium sp.]|nr:hypothetical protein [Novosphingobium sp.]
MSADLIARGLATKARSDLANARIVLDHFSDLANRRIDSTISTVLIDGLRWVRDAAASSALAASCPHLCGPDADGLYWRAKLENGLVPARALGNIGSNIVDHSANVQPLLQEALTYSYLVGAKGLLLDKPHYSLWTPSRTYGTAAINADQSGIPLIVQGRQAIASACGGTTLWRRSRSGGDPNAAGAWQVLGDGTLWRGGMILLKGLGAAPATFDDRSTVILQAIALKGGIVRDATYAGGLSLVSGKGWDVSDKPIWTENDRYCGDITFKGKCAIDGFGGELIYGQGADPENCTLTVEDSLELSNTYGDGFNPQGYNLRVNWIDIHDCGQSIEGWGGRNGVIRGIVRNCGSGNIQGGKLGAGAYSGYSAPTRIVATEAPYCTVDLHVINSGIFRLGSWLRGEMAVTDGQLQFDGGSFPDGIYDTFLDRITVITDQNTGAGVAFIGATAVQGVRDIGIGSLDLVRTAAARAAGRVPASSVGWYGSFGPNLWVRRITGEGGYPHRVTTTTGYPPAFQNIAISAAPGWIQQNVETTPALDYQAPIIGLTTTTTTNLQTVTLPNPSGLAVEGAELTLANINANGTAPILIATTYAYMLAPFALRPNTKIKFRSDGLNWHVVEAPPQTKGAVVTSQAGTTYTAVAADIDSYVRFTNGSPVTLTIQPNSAVAFPIGTVIEIEQAGAGALTVAPGSGVTINSRGADLTLAGQYAIAALKKVATDTWLLTGDL